MKNKLEQKLDVKFKELDVKPFIHHFFEVSPFSAITIASFRVSWVEVASIIHEASWSISSHNRASSLIHNLAVDYYIYGVAVCDIRDTFNRQRGRIIAKGRLLKHFRRARRKKDNGR